MKILFIHPGYWPYMAATNRALTSLTQYLASQGHEVKVICAGPNPRDLDPHGATNQSMHEGVAIHRICNLNIPALGIGWQSPVNVIRFFWLAGLLTLFWRYRYDVIVTLDLPPGMGLWGTIAQALTLGRTRHVCWLMDMLTESRFELGLWRTNHPLHRLINHLQIWPYRHASQCIVLGDCMKERLVRHHVRPEKIAVIGMWHYSSEIRPVSFGSIGLANLHHLANKFIVMYAGYASNMNPFDTVQSVIWALRDEPNIHFVLVGDSPPLIAVEADAKVHNCQNVTRLDPVEWQELSALLGTGHVHLVTLKAQMSGLCVPSKLYGILAAGRPAIFIGSAQSQAAVDLLAADAGFVLSEDQVTNIAQMIQYLQQHPEVCQQLGDNAHKNFLRHYDYSVRCGQWDEVLRRISNTVALQAHV
jgi:colanic acid biosynthesis glycosyl transferase WcaI